jgi:hypothetical protein
VRPGPQHPRASRVKILSFNGLALLAAVGMARYRPQAGRTGAIRRLIARRAPEPEAERAPA